MSDQARDKRSNAAGGDASTARRRNLRTALVLLSVAAVFFAGIIVNRWLFVH